MTAAPHPAPATADPRPTRPVVGIDVGKATCHYAIIPRPGERPTHATAPREAAAAAVLAALEGLGGEPAIIALELTGNLALPVLAALEASPHTLLIAHHTDSAALRQLLRKRKKTDTLDARLIARLAALAQHPDTAPLVRAHLDPWTTMRDAILGRASVRHLQALTRERARAKLRRQHATSAIADAHHAALIALLSQQITEAEARLIADLSPPARLLATIPTITPRRAAILDAAIGDIARFPSADKLVAYLGVTPPHRPQSGSLRGRAVRRRGSDLLHTELHMAALSIARWPGKYGVLDATYQRVKARSNGRHALWAVKRQIVRIAWGVLTSGQPHRPPTDRAAPPRAPDPGEPAAPAIA